MSLDYRSGINDSIIRIRTNIAKVRPKNANTWRTFLSDLSFLNGLYTSTLSLKGSAKKPPLPQYGARGALIKHIQMTQKGFQQSVPYSLPDFPMLNTAQLKS